MANVPSSVPRIFISHSHYDNDFCQPFVTRLRTALGATDPDAIFYDTESFRAGDDFLLRLQQEVVSRPIFIVILTPHSVIANYVKHETNLALRLTIEHPERRLIPVLAAECDPNDLAPSLLGYQMADFVHDEYERALSRLASVLMARANDSTLSSFQPSSRDLQSLQLATQAHDAAQSENWDEVILQGEFAASFPENQANATLWADMAQAYRQKRMWELAVAAARRAIDLDPFRSEVWSILADALVAEGLLEDALTAIDRARAITSPTQSALRQKLLKQRRDLLIRLRKWDLALDTITQELATTPDDAVALATRSQILLRLRRTSDRSPQVPAFAGIRENLPEIDASSQWPTLRPTATGTPPSEEPSAGTQSTAFDMGRQVRQALERFRSSRRDDQSPD